MIGTVRLEPADLSAVAAAMQRAWDAAREAFRTMPQACIRAARALWRLVRRFLGAPYRHGTLRLQRRAERRRLALMLRQQRRARAYQRRMTP